MIENNKLKIIKPDIKCWKYRENRRDEIVLTRLKLRRTAITQNYILGKQNINVTSSNVYFTVEHF